MDGFAVRAADTAPGVTLRLGVGVAAGEAARRKAGRRIVRALVEGRDVVRALEHFSAAERMLPSPGDRSSLHRGRLSAASTTRPPACTGRRG